MRTAIVGGRTYEIESSRPVSGGWLVAFSGVASRDQADALRGQEVLALRSDLAPLEPDEWYVADLVGLLAVRPDGTPLGVVSNIVNYGAGDILLIERGPAGADARGVEEQMIPLTSGVLVSVHVDEGRIVIAPPEVE
jgi:16S rRNA processing protein RimM